MYKAFDNLPKLLKFILALPCLDVVWMVYRLLRSLEHKNTLGVVLAIVLIFVGFPFMWLIDMITILLNNKVWWID